MTKSLSSSEIKSRVQHIEDEISAAATAAGRNEREVRLMAVTKYVSAPVVNAAIHAGVRLIGENREQSLCEKYGELERENVEIHFIGHLQRNKAKSVIKMTSCIQSLDSCELAAELQKQLTAQGKTIAAYVEVNIGRDPNKSGIDPRQLPGFLEELLKYPSISVRGLMTILPLRLSSLENERYFSQMHALYVDIRSKNRDNIDIRELSMGMSDDFRLAVKHGSTMVRVGSALFA